VLQRPCWPERALGNSHPRCGLSRWPATRGPARGGWRATGTEWRHGTHGATHPDSFSARATLDVAGRSFEIFRLDTTALSRFDVGRLPIRSSAVGDLLRHEDGLRVRAADIEAVAAWASDPRRTAPVRATTPRDRLLPERVLMQDFTGVPAVSIWLPCATRWPRSVVRLAASTPSCPSSSSSTTRSSPSARNPDVVRRQRRHRVRAQHRALPAVALGSGQLRGFKVVHRGPASATSEPRVPRARRFRHRRRAGLPRHPRRHRLAHHDGQRTRRARLGRGRHRGGGRHAGPALVHAAAPGGRPQAVRQMREGTTATDLVLTITELLRRHGVVGKLVEAFGPGWPRCRSRTGPPSATCRPSTGRPPPSSPSTRRPSPTCASPAGTRSIWPWSRPTAKAQGLWHDPSVEPVFSEVVELDLASVVPSLAGPSRPRTGWTWRELAPPTAPPWAHRKQASVTGSATDVVHDGDVVIAAITSCTNTSNPRSSWPPGCSPRAHARKGSAPSRGSRPRSRPARGW